VEVRKIFGYTSDLSHFRFLMIKRFSNLLYYAYEDVMPCQHVGHVHSSSKEKLLPNIDVIYIVGGNSHSSPWLFLTK
jgi:hypothetical protein